MPDEVRGYEDIKLARAARYREQLAAALTELKAHRSPVRGTVASNVNGERNTTDGRVRREDDPRSEEHVARWDAIRSRLDPLRQAPFQPCWTSRPSIASRRFAVLHPTARWFVDRREHLIADASRLTSRGRDHLHETVAQLPRSRVAVRLERAEQRDHACSPASSGHGPRRRPSCRGRWTRRRLG